MYKATSTQQVIGTMHGNRGIQFVFTLKDGSTRQVVLDFLGRSANLNGATYARCESAALQAVVRAGLDVDTFTHYLISM